MSTPATEVTAQAGVSYRQLDHWTRRGYLHPVVADPGSGRERRYTALEVAVARRIAGLVEAGLSVETAAAVARGDLCAAARLLRTLAHILDETRAPGVERPAAPEEGTR